MIASSDKILPFNTLAFPYSQTWSIDAAHTNLQRMDLNPFILTESNPQLSTTGHVTPTQLEPNLLDESLFYQWRNIKK